jgi:hypothetical protein
VLYDLQEHAVRHPLYPYLPGIYGSGANFAMRREVFERLAGFDESLGPGTPARGGEDIDRCAGRCSATAAVWAW